MHHHSIVIFLYFKTSATLSGSAKNNLSNDDIWRGTRRRWLENCRSNYWFLFKTKFGRSLHHILEMPLFVSSAVTPAVQFADIFAGIVRHYYENEPDQKEPETEFQEWLIELFTKLHNLTENNFIPKSHYLEYGFQKMGKNFSYPVSENLLLPIMMKTF